jgi:hypothetical protein
MAVSDRSSGDIQKSNAGMLFSFDNYPIVVI